MPSRSGRHKSRHDDDPYTFDDPYRNATTSLNSEEPIYEYVGTDEPPGFDDPPSHTFSPMSDTQRRPSPSRRYSHTTSPPRHSRHNKTYSPPPVSRRRSPPPKTSRRTSPLREDRPRDTRSRDVRPRDEKHGEDRHGDDKHKLKKKHRYEDLAQKPAFQRTQKYGRQGLKLVSEAAAAYAAAQAGGGAGGRGRSVDRDDYYDRPTYSPERRRSHRRSRRYSPSPSSSSPSPPPRRRSSRHDHGHRPSMAARQRSYSASPLPLSRDPDSEHDRGRRHRSSKHRSEPVSPSPTRRRGRSTPSGPPGFRSSMMDGYYKMPDDATAPNRWQMAARAALEAGGVTAFRVRKDPGRWAGEKGAKVATAALGAAAIDAFIDKDPRHARASGRGMKGFAEAAVGGMLASKLMGFKGSTTSRGKYRYE